MKFYSENIIFFFFLSLKVMAYISQHTIFILFFFSMFRFLTIYIQSSDKFLFLRNKIQIIFENLKEINNDFKFIRSQVIVASFFLILIKIIFPTTICIRIFMLLFFIIGSTYFNLRKKLQFFIKGILRKFLGLERTAFNIETFGPIEFEWAWEFVYTEKISFLLEFLKKINLEEKIPLLLEFLKKINLEEKSYKIKLVLNSFFFYILGISNFLRFIIDRNKLLYRFFYGILVFIVIFSNQGIFLSLFGLIINLNYLLFYLSDDNYSDLLEKIIFDNPNLVSSEKNIKICYQNIIIINLISIRDVQKSEMYDSNFSGYRYYKYQIEHFVFSHAEYHEYFLNDYFDEGLPFIYY